MCERFAQFYSWEEVAGFLNLLGPPQNIDGHYNVAPLQWAAVVRLNAEGHRVLEMLKWGLVPSWAKHGGFASQLINARAETITAASAYRSAFTARRCLIPVSGFYEWSGPPKQRQPWHIVREDRAPYAFAGLWEKWTPRDPPNAKTIETFAIITTEATGCVRQLHDRMPVIVAPADFDAWLDPSTPPDALQAILAHANAEGLFAYAVSPRVNSTRNDDAALIEHAS